MIITEKKIIEMMRYHYAKRLLESINETDVIDSHGNVIITKDLKVRHKDSQYEYTVDDVFQNPGTGKVQIQLRLPDEPRIDPPADTDDVLVGAPPDDLQVLDEDEIVMSLNDKEVDDVDVFIVDQEEFEKEYEVK